MDSLHQIEEISFKKSKKWILTCPNHNKQKNHNPENPDIIPKYRKIKKVYSLFPTKFVIIPICRTLVWTEATSNFQKY